MGWRVDEHYEQAERERQRNWVASLSPRERLRFRLWQACGAGMLAAIILLFAVVAFGTPIEPGRIEILDGDTIRVGDTVYRLVGFDTPEAGFHSKCERERTMAHAATRRLRLLVAGGGLDLTRVTCGCPPHTEGTPRCNYGRLCGVLKARGKDVGAILISENLARPYVCSGTRCPKRQSWCE